MKLRYIIVFCSYFLMASAHSVTEIFNQDGNKLNLLGTINGMHYISNDDLRNGDLSSVRFGFLCESKINDRITAYGKWESEVSARNNEKKNSTYNHNRVVFAGARLYDYNYLDYGCNHPVQYYISKWTNILSQFCIYPTVVEKFLTNRTNNIISYRNNDLCGLLEGLKIAIQYKGKNNNNLNTRDKYRSGYGILISYDFGNGMSAATAYSNNKHENIITTPDETIKHCNNVEINSMGLKYDHDNIYLAAFFSETRHYAAFEEFRTEKVINDFYVNANITKNLELLAQYKFSSGIRPSIGYLQLKATGKKDQRKHDLMKYLDIGTSYKLNHHMSTYIDYRINLLKKDEVSEAANLSTSNIIALGLSFIF